MRDKTQYYFIFSSPLENCFRRSLPCDYILEEVVRKNARVPKILRPPLKYKQICILLVLIACQTSLMCYILPAKLHPVQEITSSVYHDV